MSTTPPPVLGTDLIKTLQAGLNLSITGTLPGEALAVALINYCASVRSTMDKALLARLDSVAVQQIEDVQKLWRKIWIDLGVIQQ